jgi:hypothetical protein
MTLDCADMISQALWAEAYSTARHIKNLLLHSAFKLKKLPYKILYGDKPLIKHLHHFRAKCSVYVHEEKQIRISKLSPRGRNSYVIGYIESSKILQLYLQLQASLLRTIKTRCGNASCQYRLIIVLGLLQKDTTSSFYDFK